MLVSGALAFALMFVATSGSVAIPCLAGFMAAALSLAISRSWLGGRKLHTTVRSRLVPGAIGLAATYAVTAVAVRWIKLHMDAGAPIALHTTSFSGTRVLLISLVFASCLAATAAAVAASQRRSHAS